mgnify:CR=1 FL=1
MLAFFQYSYLSVPNFLLLFINDAKASYKQQIIFKLEKTKNIYVVKAEFDWNDLGSWNSIFDLSPKNKENNAIRGQGVVIDGSNNFIESKNQFTAIVGQSDLVVVSTDDATLVVERSRVEEVKRVIEFLEDSKNKKLL